MNNLEKLKEKYRKETLARNYVALPKIREEIQKEIKRVERTSLGSILPNMSEEERIQSLRLMHKLFVFSDILYGSALEFTEHMRKFDPSISIEVCNQARKAANICRDITRSVDVFKDEKMSEDFGTMCDSIQMIAMNEIYKREKFK